MSTKIQYYVSVEVETEDEALRLRKALKKELPGLPVFAEESHRSPDGEIEDVWEIQ